MEYHPRLNRENLKIHEHRIILGSFPIWSLVQSTNNLRKGNDLEKNMKIKKGEFPFFYGSSTNQFWIWYKQFVDEKIVLLDVESIKNSLNKNNIGITDIILRCKRKGISALDKDLSKREYNFDFLLYPKVGEITKILCTSKGVMNEMLLCKRFFKLHENIKIDYPKSIEVQKKIIQKLGGFEDQLRKPIYVELKVNNGGSIQCLSIPSPGSPFRRLIDFGINEADINRYLSEYLQYAFTWLKDI